MKEENQALIAELISAAEACAGQQPNLSKLLRKAAIVIGRKVGG